MSLKSRLTFFKFKIYLKRIGLLLLIVLFVYTIVVIFSPHNSNLHITASTERIEFEISGDNKLNLLDQNVILYEGFTDSIGQPFSGLIELNAGSKLIFERLSNGPLFITVNNESLLSASKAVDFNGKKIKDFKKNYDIRIDSIEHKSSNGETFLFPINGKVTIGQAITTDAAVNLPVLEKGEVSIVNLSASSIFRIRNTYIEDTYKLDLGDTFEMNQPDVIGFGLVRLDHNKGMRISYNARGKKADIFKAGSPGDGIPVKGSIVKKIFRDSFFQGVSSLLGSIGVLLGVISFFSKKKK